MSDKLLATLSKQRAALCRRTCVSRITPSTGNY